MVSGERHISRRDVGFYTLVFAACAICIFAVFPLSGHTILKYEDAFGQHVQALAYYGMWLRDLVPSLLRGDGVPAFGLSVGYGTDVLGVFHYEVIGDPLALLSAFVPASCAPALYTVLVFVRYYLAGLAFLAFTRHVLSCSRTALLVGAATYVFCGYALCSGTSHAFFLNPMICLPLVLLGLERLLAGRGPFLFIAAVALSCVSNFYFAYMVAVAVLVYLAWRLCCRFRVRRARGTAADLGRAIGAGVLGVLVSACVLLPVALFFLGGGRQSVLVEVGLFYSLDYYEKFPAAICSPGANLTNWSRVAIGPVFLLALVSLAAQRGRGDRQVKALACVLVAFLLLPVCAHVFNGFSRPLNRWVWAFSLFAAWLVSRQWDAVAAAARTRARHMAAALVCVYALAAFLFLLACGPEFSGEEVLQAGSLVPGLVFALAMLFMLSRTDGPRLAGASRAYRGAACLALLAVVANGAMYSVYLGGECLTFDELERGAGGNPYERLAAMLDEEGEAGGFARASCKSHLNEQLTQGVSAVGYYWSLAQGELARYWSELAVLSGGTGGGFTRFNDLDGRSALNALSGVRYLLAGDGEALPAGAREVEEGFSSGLDLYEDGQALPFGYTYSRELDAGWYAQASPLEREQAMLEGVLVEGSKAGADESGDEGNDGDAGEEGALPGTRPASTARDVPYGASCGEGVRQEGDSFVVEKGGAQIVLSFEGDADAETYVQMGGLWAQNAGNEAAVSIAFSAGTASKFTYFSPGHQYYYDQHDFLLNGGYSETAQTSATITFEKKGTYSLGGLHVLCQPLSGQAEKIGALGADSLCDVDFHEAGASASTSRITGRIEVHGQRKFLLVNLPYSRGWTARVDGREVELHRANTMFMGFYLDPGAHEVELSYATPGARAGLAAGAAGVAGTALWCAASRRREEGAPGAGVPACAVSYNGKPRRRAGGGDACKGGAPCSTSS